jgi:5-methylcytosine-specific restriction protein A
MGERIRGRKGVKLRKQRLYAEPLCRDCKAKGIIRAAVTPDHITPLAKGGTDTNDNIRCLCRDCHAARTAEQFGHKARQQIGADGWPTN